MKSPLSASTIAELPGMLRKQAKQCGQEGWGVGLESAAIQLEKLLADHTMHCERCLKVKQTVLVTAGLRGGKELLCGDCVGIEFAVLEEAAQPVSRKQVDYVVTKLHDAGLLKDFTRATVEAALAEINKE